MGWDKTPAAGRVAAAGKVGDAPLLSVGSKEDVFRGSTDQNV